MACIAISSLPITAHWPEVRQGAIVLAGVAAGAIFIPELNSGLWRLNAREIRDTIPEQRRRAFYTELISADCPEDEWAQRWAILIWKRGIIPLLDAARDNRRIRWDMKYEVSVHLHQEFKIGRRTELMARVETRQDDERVLPVVPDGMLWVGIAGNDASLLSEFNEDKCITRELVVLPGMTKAAWARAVRQLCHVSVRIGPRIISFDQDSIVNVPGDDNLRIVRWMVPVNDDEVAGNPVSFHIETDFPTELLENNFPVLLAGYYCAGRTNLAFRLYHGQGPRPRLRYFDEFLSEGGGTFPHGVLRGSTPQTANRSPIVRLQIACYGRGLESISGGSILTSMKWLIDCADLAIPALPDLPPVKSPKARTPEIPVTENGEPLISLSEAIRTYPVYSWMGFEHASATLRVREGVLERLMRASASLPSDFQLVVIDGHRTRTFQAELMAYYQKQTRQSLEGFVSHPYSTTVIPPHATGGAVDLTLAWRGAVLGLGTDFDSFSPQSAPGWFEDHQVDGAARDLRRLLASVLSAEGMVAIDTEWWHWSYGDQWWAAQTGTSAALYSESMTDSD